MSLKPYDLANVDLITGRSRSDHGESIKGLLKPVLRPGKGAIVYLDDDCGLRNATKQHAGALSSNGTRAFSALG
jgi:hypothetical protein